MILCFMVGGESNFMTIKCIERKFVCLGFMCENKFV
jgi:hypothetical protein